ncbi:MAG: reverse transcriptase domain-containing protein [Pseudomonadota bacterium]|nr:reverse transcriptase domain-containing protein [Pseudomonadota bacterium]
MQKAIKNEIKRLSDRIFSREVYRSKKEDEYREKFTRRTGQRYKLKPGVPPGYVTRDFDPSYCKRHANFLAKTLWHKAQSGQYKPKPALNFEIDKPGGGKRSLMAFSIPDTAFANVLMRRIRERNLKKFSPHSFAYHPEKDIFDAILDLRSYVISTPKIYTVQIDFKDYFDSIPSSYLLGLIDDRDILSTTATERYVLKQFLFHQHAKRSQYEKGRFKRRTRGTPQGSSISLLLANLANHSLDTALAKKPGKFVRFADDVTALCDRYEDAVDIEREFARHCEVSGITMNVEKSPGISILADKQAEIRTEPSIKYLGYSFRENGLHLSAATIERIKSKISRLVAIYLRKYIRDVNFNKKRASRAGGYDWDLLGLITELRNYLYGGLRESQIKGMLVDGTKLAKMRGLMSFYALLDHKDALQELDGWLVHSIRRAIKARNVHLKSHYNWNTVTPSKKSLIDGDWLDLSNWDGDDYPEVQFPSFVRGWRAARRYYLIYGLKDVEPPKYGYGY